MCIAERDPTSSRSSLIVVTDMNIWVRWGAHLAPTAYFVEYSMLSVGSVENGLVWGGG